MYLNTLRSTTSIFALTLGLSSGAFASDMQAADQASWGGLPPEFKALVAGYLPIKDLNALKATDRAGRHAADYELKKRPVAIKAKHIIDGNIEFYKTIRNLQVTARSFNECIEVHLCPGIMVRIGQLTNLRTLDLKISTGNAGLHALARLTALTTLNVLYNGVTDDGLTALAPLTALSTLNLSGNSVTSAGLTALAPLIALTTLGLSETNVTDAGLLHLTKLPALTMLELRETWVTGAGLAEFRLSHPNINIYWSRALR